jgi:SET domain-containing protein
MIAEKNDKLVLKRSRSGLGLYAAAPFKKGDFVIEYTGRRLTPEEVEKSTSDKYFFQVDKHWTIDGARRENLARYANHSCRPNCEVRIYAKRVRIWAVKNIKAGDEITYDYGEEYFDEFIKPHGCRCEKCRGK